MRIFVRSGSVMLDFSVKSIAATHRIGDTSTVAVMVACFKTGNGNAPALE